MRVWVLFMALTATFVCAQESSNYIPMYSHGSQTYYINSEIADVGEYSMLVDTGSGYSVINESTLQQLLATNQAHYISKLRGKMADGSERIVPLYRISKLSLGESCVLHDIEAAVLPNNSRQIVGISTLMQAAPFSMSFDPPTLILSQCDKIENEQVSTR